MLGSCERPGRKGDRGRVRLQMARRHADQPADPGPRTAASPGGRPLRAVPGIAGHDPYMLVHREAGQRASAFPKVTPSRPGEAGRRLLLQEGSLRRKARITLLNISGLCSGAESLTPGSRMNSAPGMLRARYSACSSLMNSSCSP